MATLTPDDLFYGTRGRVGDVVFRIVRGKTIMSRRPRKVHPAKQSAAQRKTRSRFQLATIWAKSILRDSERKAWYTLRAKELGLTNARIAAIKDFMLNPALWEREARPESSVDVRRGDSPQSENIARCPAPNDKARSGSLKLQDVYYSPVPLFNGSPHHARSDFSFGRKDNKCTLVLDTYRNLISASAWPTTMCFLN